jgi:hypothetical protein
MKNITTGETALFDYKSSRNKISGPASGRPKYVTDKKTKAKSLSENQPIVTDFQIPLYIKLYEAKSKDTIDKASFLIIKDASEVKVLEDGKHDDYVSLVTPQLESMIDKFAAAAAALNFSEGLPEDNECFKCGYMSICRKVYNVAGLERGGEAK